MFRCFRNYRYQNVTKLLKSLLILARYFFRLTFKQLIALIFLLISCSVYFKNFQKTWQNYLMIKSNDDDDDFSLYWDSVFFFPTQHWIMTYKVWIVNWKTRKSKSITKFRLWKSLFSFINKFWIGSKGNHIQSAGVS